MQVVKLTFTAFYTESGYDFVSLYNGYNSSSSRIVQLSGRHSDLPSYYSTQIYMFVNFRTNTATIYSGFIASFMSLYGKFSEKDRLVMSTDKFTIVTY